MSTVKLGIGIPTINQWPACKEFVRRYLYDFPGVSIFIVDNGDQNIDVSYFQGDIDATGGNVVVFHETKNIGVAASWNKLAREIYHAGNSHALIVNDDIYWGRAAADVLPFIEKNPRDLYKTSRDDWSLFILPKTTFIKIGNFDENFYPAYFEDRDYQRRMNLAGCSVVRSIKFDAKEFKESQSSRKDPSLLDKFDYNEMLYVCKWGGKPGSERFNRPYNGGGKRG